MATPINLSEIRTLRSQTLTPLQLEQRYQILQDLEEEKYDIGQELSPRTSDELRQVAALIERSRIQVLQGVQTIRRLDRPYYFVRYSETNIDKYNQIKNKVEQFPEQKIIVLQQVQDDCQGTWFHDALMLEAGAMAVLKNSLENT